MSLGQSFAAASASRWGWATVGLILIVIHALLLALSPRFASGVLPVIERPTGWVVGLGRGAGATPILLLLFDVAPFATVNRWSPAHR